VFYERIEKRLAGLGARALDDVTQDVRIEWQVLLIPIPHVYAPD
jgi:hypothetical protein